MNKSILILCLLLPTAAFAECTEADNYAAQYKIKEIIQKDLFNFDSMSMKDIGNEHWFIRKKSYPWARQIKDTCVREEAINYLETEMSFLKDEVDKRLHPSKEESSKDYMKRMPRVQEAGKDKMNHMEWPKAP